MFWNSQKVGVSFWQHCFTSGWQPDVMYNYVSIYLRRVVLKIPIVWQHFKHFIMWWEWPTVFRIKSIICYLGERSIYLRNKIFESFNFQLMIFLVESPLAYFKMLFLCGNYKSVITWSFVFISCVNIKYCYNFFVLRKLHSKRWDDF